MPPGRCAPETASCCSTGRTPGTRPGFPPWIAARTATLRAARPIVRSSSGPGTSGAPRSSRMGIPRLLDGGLRLVARRGAARPQPGRRHTAGRGLSGPLARTSSTSRCGGCSARTTTGGEHARLRRREQLERAARGVRGLLLPPPRVQHLALARVTIRRCYANSMLYGDRGLLQQHRQSRLRRRGLLALRHVRQHRREQRQREPGQRLPDSRHRKSARPVRERRTQQQHPGQHLARRRRAGPGRRREDGRRPYHNAGGNVFRDFVAANASGAGIYLRGRPRTRRRERDAVRLALGGRLVADGGDPGMGGSCGAEQSRTAAASPPAGSCRWVTPGVLGSW